MANHPLAIHSRPQPHGQIATVAQPRPCYVCRATPYDAVQMAFARANLVQIAFECRATTFQTPWDPMRRHAILRSAVHMPV
eukprot:10558676-Lingulodinium_polyedra.AAC.1